MKRTVLMILAFISSIFTAQIQFVFSTYDVIPTDITVAARDGMKFFFKDYKAQKLYHFGFTSEEEVDEAILGDGFQVYTVQPKDILEEEVARDFSSMAVPTNIWQFIITAGGEVKTLMTVDMVDGKWSAVSIGASELAKQLSEFGKTWQESKGYGHRLIRVYQATSDFMELSQEGKAIGVVPFTSGRMAMNLEKQEFDPFDLHNSSDILRNIRPIIRRNIQQEE